MAKADYGAKNTMYLLQFFAYEHLPAHLQEISKPFGDLANQLIKILPSNPETTVALRKLLEAKDCAVRARLFKDDRPLPEALTRKD